MPYLYRTGPGVYLAGPVATPPMDLSSTDDISGCSGGGKMMMMNWWMRAGKSLSKSIGGCVGHSRGKKLCTIWTSDTELIERTYMVTPTSTGGPGKPQKWL
ncbi:hypothetical protein GWI33_001288 [Rhynchophorus ferrugineus]|uniref:Uncharacterized protein n=1 Tax=Rhynchophorus ferrugineus TaxID=354439 RepID=A0A834HN59_RHYFE|nr:hypothetical protein GWI33_001288 [Rhynchophorus ferrugineus]